MCNNNNIIPSICFSDPTSRESFEWNGTKIKKFIGKETEVVIPEGTTEIGENAFRGCSSLTSVMIPETVTEIGDEAFSGCSSLTSVVIPESVTEIGYYAFSGCRSLTSVVIPKGPQLKGRVFWACGPNLTIHAPVGSAAEKYAEDYEITHEVIS